MILYLQDASDTSTTRTVVRIRDLKEDPPVATETTAATPHGSWWYQQFRPWCPGRMWNFCFGRGKWTVVNYFFLIKLPNAPKIVLRHTAESFTLPIVCWFYKVNVKCPQALCTNKLLLMPANLLGFCMRSLYAIVEYISSATDYYLRVNDAYEKQIIDSVTCLKKFHTVVVYTSAPLLRLA